MPWWKDKITDSDREAVNQAILEAESRTSAEIIPVIAKCSGRYDRAEDTVGVWFAIVVLTITWYLTPIPEIELGSWQSSHPWGYWAVLAGSILVGFIVGTVLANYLPGLRWLFIPKRQMRDEVQLRAQAVFFDSRVHHTAGGTGVLLYVSLYERMAAIYADRVVIQKLGQASIDALCKHFTERLGKEKPTQALCETAKELGALLNPVLPRDGNDVNELPDSLRLLD